MKVLLDENIPRTFCDHLRATSEAHSFSTVHERGWAGTKNGELLAKAATAGCDTLVTMDAGFEHQHDQRTLPLSVVIVKARSNRVGDLIPLTEPLIQEIESTPPQSVTTVDPREQ